MPPRAIQAVCYADFHGDLKRTACGLELGDGLADFDGPVTVYMSSTTCPSCRTRIDEKIARLGQSGFDPANPGFTTSSTILCSSQPAPRSIEIP